MSSCIYFHPEAYTTSGRKLMGRNAAGESFLRGYFAHSRVRESLWVQAISADHFAGFEESARNLGRKERIQGISNANLVELRNAEVVYHPGPGIGEHAIQRRFFGDQSWCLCGITHTTSSARAMDAIAELVTAPVQPWDAVICPSRAVKENVETILRSQARYLQQRIGATKIVLPKFPVIPLGIHTDDFKYSDEQRAGARKRIKAKSDTIVVLYMGRLSFHAKAHPLAMYQALEQASKASGKDVILVECGWHANEHIEGAFKDAAKAACPSVRVIHLDGREAKNREISWASADIFCSLPDNIQETFGIVPIEAMAAGLPVVVSDWDGYRDTVRDGIDGFRVPTVAPAPGLAGDLAYRHAIELDTYDMYCGHTSSLVAVDVVHLTRVLAELMSSTELRKKMGSSGRQRAASTYDWRQIIKQYEDLWEEQRLIRSSAQNSAITVNGEAQNVTWAARLDPTIGFSGYPTSQLSEGSKIRLNFDSKEDILKLVGEYMSLSMINYASYVLPSELEIEIIIENSIRFRNQDTLETTAHDIISTFPEERQPFMLRSLVWFIKIGIFSLP